MALFAGSNTVRISNSLTKRLDMAFDGDSVILENVSGHKELLACEVRDGSCRVPILKIKAQEIFTKKEYVLEGSGDIQIPTFDVTNYKQGQVLIYKEMAKLSDINGKWIQVQDQFGKVSYAKVTSVSMGMTHPKLYDIYRECGSSGYVVLSGIVIYMSVSQTVKPLL